MEGFGLSRSYLTGLHIEGMINKELGGWASADHIVDRYLSSVLCRPIPFLTSPSSFPLFVVFASCFPFLPAICPCFLSLGVAVMGFAFPNLG